MVLYEVNLTVEPAMSASVEAWLPQHIDEMLALDGFERAEWYDLEPGSTGETRWTIHYFLTSQNHYQAYLDGHAERMRAEGINRFGGHFTATRRVLFHRRTKVA